MKSFSSLNIVLPNANFERPQMGASALPVEPVLMVMKFFSPGQLPVNRGYGQKPVEYRHLIIIIIIITQ